MSNSDDPSGGLDNFEEAHRHIPACDFGRRRVADLLRRERPRREQEEASLKLVRILHRMCGEARDSAGPIDMGVIYVGKRPILTYNLLGRVPLHAVMTLGRGHVPSAWKWAANFQSKFLKLPPPRD